MKSNVIALEEGGHAIYRTCRNCGAKHMIGPRPEFFCGAKERIEEDGTVTVIVPCPRNRPWPN